MTTLTFLLDADVSKRLPRLLFHRASIFLYCSSFFTHSYPSAIKQLVDEKQIFPANSFADVELIAAQDRIPLLRGDLWRQDAAKLTALHSRSKVAFVILHPEINN